jgi:hypothetical protein
VLYRVRDGAYAADLLIAAVAELDVFSRLAVHEPVPSRALRSALGLAARPTDVLLAYCAALGLVDRDLADGDRIALTDLGRHHLLAGSAFDLRAYYASLAERPTVAELAEILRTNRQAAWASAPAAAAREQGTDGGAPQDWSSGLADAAFAQQITAAMDARGAFLAPALAEATADLPISAAGHRRQFRDLLLRPRGAASRRPRRGLRADHRWTWPPAHCWLPEGLLTGST